jgi:hypothetical protein
MTENHLICEWGTKDGFLLHHIMPDTPRLQLDGRETKAQILESIPPNVTTVWWHINLTQPHKLFSHFASLNHALQQRGIRSVNGNLADISKSSMMRAIKNAGGRVPIPVEGDWVIVKTNNNHSGVMDSKWALATSDCDLSSVEPLMIFNPKKYPVVKFQALPPEWLCSKQIVVQKYIANNASYFIRAYFLGNSLVTSVARSVSEVKRMSSYIERRQIQHDPCENQRRNTESDIIRQLRISRTALHAEFGTADLVVDNFFRCWVVDVNSTPFLGEGQFRDITSVLSQDRLAK